MSKQETNIQDLLKCLVELEEMSEARHGGIYSVKHNFIIYEISEFNETSIVYKLYNLSDNEKNIELILSTFEAKRLFTNKKLKLSNGPYNTIYVTIIG
jgi:predicted rRNA methylase YqxC with S4 and FtsJ domains